MSGMIPSEPPWLVVEHPDGTRDHARLTLSLTTIGRSDQNVVELLDPKLSRFHCEVERRGERWVVRDCNSRNGTLLNGAPVVGTLPLGHGDVISIGQSRLSFLLERPDELRTDAAVPFVPLRAGSRAEAAEVTAEMDTPAVARRRPTHGFDPRQTVTLEEVVPRTHQGDVWRTLANLSDAVVGATSRPELLERAIAGARLLLQARGALLALGDERRPAELTVVASDGLDAGGRARCVEVARRVIDVRGQVIQDRRCVGIPLLSQGRLRGALAVHDLPRAPARGAEELEALERFAGVVGSTLAGSVLLEEVRREERGAGARRIAQDLRAWLRADPFPQAPGLDAGAATLASDEVGRDAFEALAVGDALYLIVGDVPAAGTPLPVRLRRAGERSLVSLLGQAELRGALRCVLADDPGPAVALDRLEEALGPGGAVSQVGLTLVRYEPASGRLGLAGAGGPPLLLRRSDGAVEAYPAGRPPLGHGGVPPAVERALDWAPGDAILLASAGVPRAAEGLLGEGGLAVLWGQVGGAEEGAAAAARVLLDRLTIAARELDVEGMSALVLRRTGAA